MFQELKSWFQRAAAGDAIDEATFVGTQAKFLLSQAALVGAPESDSMIGPRLRAMRVPFAYVNPKTFSAFNVSFQNHGGVFVTVGSPTKWILTDLMPEGGLILTPNVMPGLADLIEEQENIEREYRSGRS